MCASITIVFGLVNCVVHLLIPNIAIHVCHFLQGSRFKNYESTSRWRSFTDRRETGMPSRVVGPMPSTFFGGAWVDVILLVSSNLLSLASLLKSRLTVYTERRGGGSDYVALNLSPASSWDHRRFRTNPSPNSFDLTGLRGFVLNVIDFSFGDDEFWRLFSTFSLMWSTAEKVDKTIRSTTGKCQSSFTSRFPVDDVVRLLFFRRRNCVPTAALDNHRLIRFVGIVGQGPRRRCGSVSGQFLPL